MGSEGNSLDGYADPCHLLGAAYKYYPEKEPSQSKVTDAVPSTSTSSGSKDSQSMLVTGFAMRNWESLHRALLDDEQRRQMLLAQHDKEGEEIECESISSDEVPTEATMKSVSRSTVFSKETELVSVKSPSLEYLMGLAKEAEAYEEMVEPEEKRKLESAEEEAKEKADEKVSEAMKQARKYLSQHKIFEFFSFLIAHMLSELPDNPIEFLITLLDRCLLYRSGYGNPPLLFEKPHIEQLFILMDRMRTGFIEKEQYETGMRTLGICSFDKTPPLTTDGMVSRDFFIEEAYECLTDLFVEMIRRRGGQMTPPSLMTPPPTAVEPSLISDGE